MARYNEILVGRYARMLQKLFGVKGEVPIASLAGEVQTVFPLFSGVENRYLESWNRFGMITDAGPTAANQSGGRIRNPAGSNVIAVIEKLSICEPTATDRLLIQMGQATTDLGTVQANAGTAIDRRTGVFVGANCIISQQSSAVALPALTNQFTLWGNFVLANTPYDFIMEENQELTLLPGDAIQVSAATVNVRFLAAILWRERFLEEPERQ